jgi:hypothetical protein
MTHLQAYTVFKATRLPPTFQISTFQISSPVVFLLALRRYAQQKTLRLSATRALTSKLILTVTLKLIRARKIIMQTAAANAKPVPILEFVLLDTITAHRKAAATSTVAVSVMIVAVGTDAMQIMALLEVRNRVSGLISVVRMVLFQRANTPRALTVQSHVTTHPQPFSPSTSVNKQRR